MAKKLNDTKQKINEAIDAYFESNLETNCFPAKKLMPALIENDLFEKDKKNGMPLRQVLRALDVKNELGDIPRLHAERINNDVYWYFLREGEVFSSNHVSNTPNAKQQRAEERANSDEVYIMDLIDELLEQAGSRKHTFEYLLGDLHQNGKTRTLLAIDVYYEHLGLAIEIVKHPDTQKSAEESQEEKLTVSGITRAEQRLKYYNRKRKMLTEKDKYFVGIPIVKFSVDASLKLVRKKAIDEQVLRELLSDFMK